MSAGYAERLSEYPNKVNYRRISYIIAMPLYITDQTNFLYSHKKHDVSFTFLVHVMCQPPRVYAVYPKA